MKIWVYCIYLKLGHAARMYREAEEVLSNADGLGRCRSEQDQCKLLLSSADSSDPSWVSSGASGCEAPKGLLATKCVLCLTEECSYKDDYYFLLTDGGTEAGNCTKLAHKDPSFHISGNNGTCDQCDSHYLLKKKYNYDCQPTDWTKVNGYQSCKLRGRHNGAEVTYAIRDYNCETADGLDCRSELYVDQCGTLDFLSIEVDIKIYIALMISFAAALVAAIFCLFSHTPFMIENSICHKNFSCYRWSNWICACCPREFLTSSCNSCKKKVKRTDGRYTRLGSSGRSRLDSARSRLDSGRYANTQSVVRFQYENMPHSQSSYQSFNV